MKFAKYKGEHGVRVHDAGDDGYLIEFVNGSSITVPDLTNLTFDDPNNPFPDKPLKENVQCVDCDKHFSLNDACDLSPDDGDYFCIECKALQAKMRKDFLAFHSGYYGEKVDNIKQIVYRKFTGEELCEYVTEFRKRVVRELIEYIESDSEIAIPINRMFVKDENSEPRHITKKEYGQVLLEVLCDELRTKFKSRSDGE